MSILARLTAALKGFRRSFEDYDEKKWRDFLAGPLTGAGVRVNEVSSLKLSAVFAAVSFLANTIASLPFIVYRRRLNGGKEHALDHPLYDRLHNKPNENLSSWQWRFTGIVHKTLWGSWYTHVQRKSYQNQQLLPLLPDRTYPDPIVKTRYVTLVDGKPVYIDRADMLHVPHFSLDGVQGKGVVHYARESLGIGRALDEYAAAFFGSGVHPGGIVEMEAKPDEQTRQGLQKDFNEKYRGLGKAHHVIFMTGGAKFKAEEFDLEKIQALESRQFSVVEAARWFGLPPHVLRDLARATFSNIEHQGLELVIYSLLPLVTQIEQACNLALFDDEERRNHYVKLELKGLLRGDLAARTAFYTVMLDRGVFNADQVLELEDLNPQPDGMGQIYVMPLNMINKATLVRPMPAGAGPRGAGWPRQGVEVLLEGRRLLPGERRNSALRRKITLAYQSKFADYANETMKQEIEAVRAAAKEMLSQRALPDFKAWLARFYPDFASDLRQAAAPLLGSYAAAILPVAQEEIASEADVSARFDPFVAEYIDALVERHVGLSRAQLLGVLEQAEQEQADPAEAVLGRLEEWEEKRADKIVMYEPMRAENAFSRTVFALCGIAKIVSMAHGDNCPYCTALDGRVIGIDEAFLEPGDFEPDGAERPLNVNSTLRHPPYHDGCDCSIEASI